MADPKPPVLNEDFSTVIVVDNLPVVKAKRFDKLLTVVRKLFKPFGNFVGDVFLPVHDVKGENKTVGHAFIEYETKEAAFAAIRKNNHRKLDTKHTLRVNTYDDFAEYKNRSEEWVKPSKDEHGSKTNPGAWLLDGRDQLVVRYGSETEIYWHDTKKSTLKDCREKCYFGDREKKKGKDWTQLYVNWSPQGSFFVTFHGQGLVVWGGPEFEKRGRLAHPDVKRIEWSPCEQYLVTCNLQEGSDNFIIVWDVRTQKKLRQFTKGGPFKWSHDDKYIARKGQDCISVYSLPTMGLLDKKSIKIPGVGSMQWSPTDNIISYWVPELDNIPAKVTLITMPDRKVIRKKHLYNVKDIQMDWQLTGDYLSVKMSRQLTKTTKVNNFEIFRMRSKSIPIELCELKEPVVAFSWEKNGGRFGIVHGDGARPDVSFYQLNKKKLKLRETLKARPANAIYWSPNGQYVVVAGLGHLNGALEFLDASNFKPIAEPDEHFMCNAVSWSSCGLYVLTCVTQPLVAGANFRFTMDNGYKIWSAHGQCLAAVGVDSCYQVMWRPRPKTLLSKEQIDELRSNLKTLYWKDFERQDDEIRQSKLSGAARDRKNKRDEWRKYRAERDEEYHSEAPLRAQLRDGLLSDDENDFVEIEDFEEEEVSCTTETM